MCYASNILYPGEEPFFSVRSVQEYVDDQTRYLFASQQTVYVQYHEDTCSHEVCAFDGGPCVFHPEDCSCCGESCVEAREARRATLLAQLGGHLVTLVKTRDLKELDQELDHLAKAMEARVDLDLRYELSLA